MPRGEAGREDWGQIVKCFENHAESSVHSKGSREPLQVLEHESDMARCIFWRNHSGLVEELAWSREDQICGCHRAESALNQDSGCRRKWDRIQCHTDERVHFSAFFGTAYGLMTRFWQSLPLNAS